MAADAGAASIEQSWIYSKVHELRELDDELFTCSVYKLKADKVTGERVLVLTYSRLFLVKREGRGKRERRLVRNEIHLADLTAVRNKQDEHDTRSHEVVLEGRNQYELQIMVDSAQADCLVDRLWRRLRHLTAQWPLLADSASPETPGGGFCFFEDARDLVSLHRDAHWEEDIAERTEWDHFRVLLDSLRVYHEVDISQDAFDALQAMFNQQRCVPLPADANEPMQESARAENARHLDFSLLGSGQTAASVALVLRALWHGSFFTHVSLRDIALDEDALVALAELLARNTTLQSLMAIRIVSNKNLSNAVAALIPAAASNADSALVHLDLGGNTLSDKVLGTWANSLREWRTPMQSFSIRYSRCSAKPLSALLSVLSASLGASLRHLDVSGNAVGGRGTKALVAWLRSPHCALQHLKVRGADVDVEQLITEGVYANEELSLVSIDVARSALTDKAARTLAKLLAWSTSLHEVGIAHTKVSRECLEAVCAALLFNPLLNDVSIDISGNDCGALVASRLASMLVACPPDKVRSLRCADCDLGGAGLASIVKALRRHRQLYRLVCDRNVLANERDDALPLQFAGLVLDCSNLHVLRVAGDIGPVEEADVSTSAESSVSAASEDSAAAAQYGVFVVPMLQALSAPNCSVRRCDVSGNFIGVTAMEPLCFLLKRNTSLVELKLLKNDFTEDGFRQLALAVAENKTLTELPFPDGDMQRAAKSTHSRQMLEGHKTSVLTQLRRNRLRMVRSLADSAP